MLMMISVQDDCCSIFTPFHFAPESNHVFNGVAADKMTEKGCHLYPGNTLQTQTTSMVSRLNEENQHNPEILRSSFKVIEEIEL